MEGNREQTYNIGRRAFEGSFNENCVIDGKVALRLPKISSLVELTSVRISIPLAEGRRPGDLLRYCRTIAAA